MKVSRDEWASVTQERQTILVAWIKLWSTPEKEKRGECFDVLDVFPEVKDQGSRISSWVPKSWNQQFPCDPAILLIVCALCWI